MANNPYVNKVIYGSTTLIDISDTTATADKILQGYTAYGANGQKLIGIATGGSATQHVIHFDFTDSTDTDINVYYNDALISTMITAYEPENYGQKIVEVAELDGVEWYRKPTEVWELLYNEDNVGWYPEETGSPYCWIQELADVEIPLNSVWRVTFDNVEYRLVGKYSSEVQDNIIGNPVWGGVSPDDGSNVPFFLWPTPWGAWSGNADVLPDTRHALKVERLITS